MNYIVNTNKNKMELFAVVADMQGKGLPLSCLFEFLTCAPLSIAAAIFISYKSK